MQRQTLLQKCFYDKENKLVVFQFPNIPIIIALVAWLTSHLPFLSDIKAELQIVTSLFLFIWAYLEVTGGANYFRRLFGAIVGLIVFINLITSIT